MEGGLTDTRQRQNSCSWAAFTDSSYQSQSAVTWHLKIKTLVCLLLTICYSSFHFCSSVLNYNKSNGVKGTAWLHSLYLQKTPPQFCLLHREMTQRWLAIYIPYIPVHTHLSHCLKKLSICPCVILTSKPLVFSEKSNNTTGHVGGGAMVMGGESHIWLLLWTLAIYSPVKIQSLASFSPLFL